MYFISEFHQSSRRFRVCDVDTGKSKLISKSELITLVTSGREVYGVTNTVWFIPVSSVRNSSTEIVFTFDIWNTNEDWNKLVSDGEEDGFFRVDVTIDSFKAIEVEFYYIYPSNDMFNITDKVGNTLKSYIEFYAIGLYQRSVPAKKQERQVKKGYKLLATEYAERYGIIEYRIKGNLMIYNVSYPAYLSNPRYTIQHTVNLDSEVEQTKQLKRFDSKGLVNRH